MSLHALLRPPIDMDALAQYLDGLSSSDRIAQCVQITAKEQADLYEAARGYRKITVDDIVPPGLPALHPVHHWGRNSLAMFRRFQKRFCRPDDAAAAAAGELWGYNHQALSFLTGPGYYVAYNLADGEVLVDYTRLPPRGAPTWPRVRSNRARLGRFVYYLTQDTLRGVSRHVTIGRAARLGKLMPNWFVLCREDPPAALPGRAPAQLDGLTP